jgi:RNA polymerase sigma-70 factor (ECF subfamily)
MRPVSAIEAMSRALDRNHSPAAQPAQRAFGAVDQARLSRLVGEHFDVLWRFLRRLGLGNGEVDDAVQEVVSVLARKLALVEPGSERAFLLSTAFRVAATFRRSARRRREVDDAALYRVETPDADPELSLERKRLLQSLQHALDALPLELRAVFVLHELEELTMAQIAITLELAPGTVASRLRRARELFEGLASDADTKDRKP